MFLQELSAKKAGEHAISAPRHGSGATFMKNSSDLGETRFSQAKYRVRNLWPKTTLLLEPIKFSVVGLVGFVVNMVSFKLLLLAGVSSLFAPIPAFLIAVTNNYILNSKFTFRTPSHKYLRLDKYALYVGGNVAGLGVNLTVYYPCLLLLGLSPLVSQFTGILSAAICDFIVARMLLRT